MTKFKVRIEGTTTFSFLITDSGQGWAEWNDLFLNLLIYLLLLLEI